MSSNIKRWLEALDTRKQMQKKKGIKMPLESVKTIKSYLVVAEVNDTMKQGMENLEKQRKSCATPAGLANLEREIKKYDAINTLLGSLREIMKQKLKMGNYKELQGIVDDKELLRAAVPGEASKELLDIIVSIMKKTQDMMLGNRELKSELEKALSDMELYDKNYEALEAEGSVEELLQALAEAEKAFAVPEPEVPAQAEHKKDHLNLN